MGVERRAGREDAGRWITVGLGFLTLAVAFSARATLGLMMTTWIRELGWSRGLISGAAAMALVVMAAIAPLAGRLVDRQGPRTVLATGLLLLAIGGLGLAGYAWRRKRLLLGAC